MTAKTSRDKATILRALKTAWNGKRRFICGPCANSVRHQRQYAQQYGMILDGRLVTLIRCIPSRPRVCADCGQKRVHGWRDK